jgi:cytochrome c heme-lyase
VDHAAGADKCPVEPSRSSWLSFLSKSPTPPDNTSPQGLSTARTPSSIPKQDSGTWTYPSEAQFFAAMARKNHNPSPSDMRTIVPIHNAVNERAWGEVMRWEQGRGGEKCGGVKLVNFRGKPGERSWKAWGKVLLG